VKLNLCFAAIDCGIDNEILGVLRGEDTALHETIGHRPILSDALMEGEGLEFCATPVGLFRPRPAHVLALAETLLRLQ
jgi:hypothetical protein